MLKYIAKRIGLALITIFTVATLTFFLMILMKKDASCIQSAAMTAVSCTAGTDGFPL